MKWAWRHCGGEREDKRAAGRRERGRDEGAREQERKGQNKGGEGERERT